MSGRELICILTAITKEEATLLDREVVVRYDANCARGSLAEVYVKKTYGDGDECNRIVLEVD